MAALATPLELASHLQIERLDLATANLALAGASGAVRSYCGWTVLRATETLTVDGEGSRVLTLPTLHLASVDEVRIDGLALDPDGAQPTVHPRGQLIWANTWPALSKIEVDCEHGFEATPDVVRLVTLTLAARIFNNPDHVKTASVGTVTRTYDANLTALDMRLLDPYRLE